ncbi:MAG: serine/threonine-protein kinase [Planctomycetota bacterium]
MLARGGMGTVYDAEDPELGRRVVVKTLHPALLCDEQARDRLRREARVLGSLDHPHLLKITDVVEQDDELFLVMPHHDGHTLAQRLGAARAGSEHGEGAAFLRLGDAARDRARCLREVLVWFRRVASALHTAHAAGIVHRDIKPENLLVTAVGVPIVLDFGLAVATDTERLTAAGELLGTPLYMAPELIDGHAATPRSDVYSLGVCLYEALTLVQPFAGAANRQATFHRIQAGDVVPPRRHAPLLSRDLEAVVLRAMDREPGRRYASAAALADELQRVLDLQPTEARPVSGVTQAWRRVRRRPWFSVVCGTSVVMAALLVWLFVRHQEMRGDIDAFLHSDSPEARNALEKYRGMIEQGGEGIVLLHPRGKVASFDRLEWLGNEPADKGSLNGNRYRVQLLDADGRPIWATSTDYVQGASRRCVIELPSTVSVGAAVAWTVEWVGDDHGTAEAAELEELRAEAPGLYEGEARFEVVPSTASMAWPPDATQLHARLDAGYASEVLSALANAPESGPGSISLVDQAELQRDAATVLELHQLAEAAQSALLSAKEGAL